MNADERMIFNIATGVQFLYPCIAYGEREGDKILITTETNISRLFPSQLSVKGMEAMGEDYFGNPLFKDGQEDFYCAVGGGLYYKGKDPDGDPQYAVNKGVRMQVPEINEGDVKNKFNDYMQLLRDYAEGEGFRFAEAKTSIKAAGSLRDGKIECVYTLQRL